MFAVSARHTMANAKFAQPKTEVETINLVELHKQRARDHAIAEGKRRAAERERLRLERLAAEEAMRKGRATALKWRMADGCAYRTTYRGIEARICRALQVRRDEIYSDRRTRRIVLARHAIAYWACRLTLMSLPEIGRKMGNKDHTTVLHARDSYPDKRARQGRFLRAVR